MKAPLQASLAFAAAIAVRGVLGAAEVAELNFGPEMDRPAALAAAKVPAWVSRVEQQGGRWLSEPRCWNVQAQEPEGVGRLSIALDRKLMNADLAATIVFEAAAAGDVAVQLFDPHGRSVVTDLFGNLVDVSAELATETFVIPWRKYPDADRVVLRRIKGDVKIYGVALYPVAVEGQPVHEELEKLARVLGDPLSPSNPLLKSVQSIAGRRDVALAPSAPGGNKAPAAKPEDDDDPVKTYAAAARPGPGAKVLAPTAGLVAWWNFDADDARDASGHGHDGVLRGGPEFVDGIHGRALSLRRNPATARKVSWDSVTLPPGPALALHRSMTIAAWVHYRSIAPHWGAQIAWFGDENNGRDPWTLALFTGGKLWLRSDRSVTGRPQFTVFEDEIYLTPQGRPMMNQHVDTWSPGRLSPGTWYFVAGSIEKLSERKTALRLYVNAEKVSETLTNETVNYPTEGMWMTIGAVELGTWQNFDGMLDEVRLYDRPLSGAEICALYRQPWTR